MTRHQVTGAALIAALLLLTIVWKLRRLDRRIAAELGERKSAGESWLTFVLTLLSAAFFAATIVQGSRQDYYLYRGIWGVVREWHDPWFTTLGAFGNYPLNAYGPLFNLLAIPDWFNPLLPKLLFAWAYLDFAVRMVKTACPDLRRAGAAVAGILWFWNPYAWVEVARYGHFDVLIGLSCVAAVEARIARRDLHAGISLALGVLLKYMPIILLPFVVLDRGRLRMRLLGVAMGAVALGLLVSLVIWGPATFRPIFFAVRRQPEYLSIYRYLQGKHSPLRDFDFSNSLSDWAAPILLVALLRCWNWSRLRGTEPASSTVLAAITTVLFYHVGFPQYQMVPFILSSYWVVRRWELLRHRPPLLAALGLYFAWIATFDVIETTLRVDYRGMNEWAGLPTFVLGSFLIACIVRSSPTEEPEAIAGKHAA